MCACVCAHRHPHVHADTPFMPGLPPELSPLSSFFSFTLISLYPQKGPKPQALLPLLTMTTIPPGLAEHSAHLVFPRNLRFQEPHPSTNPGSWGPTSAGCWSLAVHSFPAPGPSLHGTPQPCGSCATYPAAPSVGVASRPAPSTPAGLWALRDSFKKYSGVCTAPCHLQTVSMASHLTWWDGVRMRPPGLSSAPQ